MLGVSGHGEARATMEAAVITARVKGNKQRKVVVKERTTVMDVGILAYYQGAYFPVIFFRLIHVERRDPTSRFQLYILESVRR